MSQNQISGPNSPAAALARAAYRADLNFAESDGPPSLEVAQDAIAFINRSLSPINEIDKRFKSTDEATLEKALSESPDAALIFGSLTRIGRKIRPDFSQDQAMQWTAAVTLALTDLPANVAIKACVEALHIPVSFPADVERVVRDRAAAIIDRQKIALSRLRHLIRDVEQANQPTLPPPPPDKPLTDDERDKLNLFMLRRNHENRFFPDGTCRPLEPGEIDPALGVNLEPKATGRPIAKQNYEPLSAEEMQARATALQAEFDQSEQQK